MGIYNLYNNIYGQCEAIQCTAMVIEDAETLGALLSRVESRAQVSQMMMAYEDIRLPRCSRIHQLHWYLDTIYKIPAGPQQELRDSVLRRTLVQRDWDEFDATGFQEILGDIVATFAYDATEAVEDWRASRGGITPCQRSPIQIWITQE